MVLTKYEGRGLFRHFEIKLTFQYFHNLRWVLASPRLCPYICTIFTVFTIYNGISKTPTLFPPALIFFNIFTTSKKLQRELCSITFVTFTDSIPPLEISITCVGAAAHLYHLNFSHTFC